MQIQGGMLEALGINMYTSIGKCLVEFIANAYDSDAPTVDVAIPYDRIATSRKAARAAAKTAAAAAGEDGFNVLIAPLPDDVEIVIADTPATECLLRTFGTSSCRSTGNVGSTRTAERPP